MFLGLECGRVVQVAVIEVSFLTDLIIPGPDHALSQIFFYQTQESSLIKRLVIGFDLNLSVQYVIDLFIDTFLIRKLSHRSHDVH